ncbi:MAG: signal peptide peptidase SppA [Myxococcaceae bacterium]
MDRRSAWVLGIVFGGLFLCLFGFLLVLYLAVKSDGGGGSLSGDRVGGVEILGPISVSKRALKDLAEFKDNEKVKAIVVRVDSPGGSVGPSQEIYEAIKRINQKKKVVVSMGSMAASGGFYIACAGEKVYANPGTLTGSIGVIMQIPNVSGVLKWAGVEMNTITSGKLKDSGSPFRPMSEEEHRYFEALLLDVHQQFIEAVAEGRKLKVDDVRPFADGRVFSGKQAKEMKLVDELGGLEDAVAAAGKLGGIEGEPKTEYPKREKKLLKELLGGDEVDTLFQGAAVKALEHLGGVGLQYRLPLVDAQ